MCERLEGEVEVHEEDAMAAPWLQRGSGGCVATVDLKNKEYI